MGYDDEVIVDKKYMECAFDKLEVEASTDSKLISVLVYDTDENKGMRLEFTLDEAVRLEKLLRRSIDMLQADRPSYVPVPDRYRFSYD